MNSNGMGRLTRFSAVLLLTLICFFLLPRPLSHAATDSGYDITAYNVDINVGADNVFHITETITADFHTASHGIYRYLPYRQEMLWDLDGTQKRIIYNTAITSVNVFSDPYTTYNQSGNMVIKIGSGDKFVSGKKVYKLSYDYSLGNDQIKTLDFIYYNIIGTFWDCNISNVTFNITMPKSFSETPSFFYGAEGSSVAAPVQYAIKDNTISGTLTAKLTPGQALTVQMDLPEGYFTIPTAFPWELIIMLSAFLIAALSLILFLFFGRDRILIKPVEFYPPDGITPAEAGYIIDTTVDDKDVVSLIIYWASKGYLKIEQREKDEFRLSKLKELTDVPNNYEAYFFSEIFKNRDEVLLSELTHQTFTQVSKMKTLVREHFAVKERRLYSRKSSLLGDVSLLLASLPVLATVYLAVYTVSRSVGMSFAFAFIATLLVFMPIGYLKGVAYRWNVMRKTKRVFTLLFGILLTAVFLGAYIVCMIWQGMTMTGIMVAAATLISGIICVFMRRRTPYGDEMLGQLLGFKNFLEVAEKDRLERLVMETPSYFYDILPYAYVLGVSDKWAKKFDGIAMQPPEWYAYDRSNNFSAFLFYNMMFRSMNTMGAAISTPPVQTGKSGFGGSGGGSFGGGGFSGGGFGGGGGGRW